MNRFLQWMLRKYIRANPISSYKLILKMLWGEAKRNYYEDNVHTIYWYLEEYLYREYTRELDELHGKYGGKK